MLLGVHAELGTLTHRLGDATTPTPLQQFDADVAIGFAQGASAPVGIDPRHLGTPVEDSELGRFLADRTIGRAFGTLFRLSVVVCLSVVCL